MANKKFKLTKETIEYLGVKIYRIEALKDFSDVKKGDKGGFIEKESNLSQEDNAWVYGNARVHDNAWVYDNAKVYGNAEVSGDAEVFANARVYGDAGVFGNARVYGDAWVYGDAGVFGNAKLKERLCSKFSFKNDKQVKLWLNMEKEFEEKLKEKDETNNIKIK